jgi:hypothetical protein
MKKTAIRFVFLAAFGASAMAETPIAAGHWEGRIQIPEHELSITVDLARSPNGKWIGSISVLKTTATDVPLDSIAVDDAGVRFKAGLPGNASFEGVLSTDGTRLSGKAANAEGEAPFQLARNGEADVKIPPASTALPKEFEGTWDGSLDAGAKLERVGMRLTRAENGLATATLIVIDSKLEIAFTTVTIDGKRLLLEARSVSGKFDGTLGSEGDISGEWTQGPSRLALTFKRASSKPERP